MLRVAGIVLLSSSYLDIFNTTDLLSGFGGLIWRLVERVGTFRAMMLASVLVSDISCNQTFATILTAQLRRPCYARRQDMATPPENSAILIAAPIPWSIADSLPCATLNVTMVCLLYALYLYLVSLANALCKDPGPDGPEPATFVRRLCLMVPASRSVWRSRLVVPPPPVGTGFRCQPSEFGLPDPGLPMRKVFTHNSERKQWKD